MDKAIIILALLTGAFSMVAIFYGICHCSANSNPVEEAKWIYWL
jgi:hypothetical protein